MVEVGSLICKRMCFLFLRICPVLSVGGPGLVVPVAHAERVLPLLRAVDGWGEKFPWGVLSGFVAEVMPRVCCEEKQKVEKEEEKKEEKKEKDKRKR